MLRAGRSHDALALLQPLLRDDASSNAFDQTPDVAARFGACCLAAQYHANNAQHEAAWHLCQRALALDALAPLPYHIQARIEDERGNGEHAKELLKKVIYLAPQSPVAMMELAAIYRREGDTQRARCWHDSALQALIEYSNNDELALPQWSLDATQHAGSLRAHCENAVRENALFNSVATEVIVQKFSGM